MGCFAGALTRRTFAGWKEDGKAWFENGDECDINGEKKARRADVRFECGKETKVTQTSESPICEYHLVVSSPCACTDAVLEPLLAQKRDLEAMLID